MRTARERALGARRRGRRILAGAATIALTLSLLGPGMADGAVLPAGDSAAEVPLSETLISAGRADPAGPVGPGSSLEPAGEPVASTAAALVGHLAQVLASVARDESASAALAGLLAATLPGKPPAVVDPALLEAVRAPAGAGGELLLIVSYWQQPGNGQVAVLESLGAEVVYRFSELPMVAVRAPLSLVGTISELPGVRSVYRDRELVYDLRDSVPFIGADRVWSDPVLGFTGRGVTVAVVDSGIDATHPDLPPGEHKVVRNVKPIAGDFVSESGPPLFPTVAVEQAHNTDLTIGHGTHVAGIVAGTGAAAGGRYAGVAPGARLVGYSTDVGLYLFYVLRAFDYVLAHQYSLGIRVVSNSWGSGPSPDCKPEYDSPIAIATRLMHDRGMAVVFSAGNNGPNPGTIGREKMFPWVLAVAAGTKTGGLAAFSSRGCIAEGINPTLTAPGVDIIAPRAKTGAYMNALAPLRGDLALSGTEPLYYTRASGTSMAAPHVSGVVALMLEANPRLTPRQVKQVLMETATPMPGYEPWEVGAGYLDAYAAVWRARQLAGAIGPDLPPPARGPYPKPSPGTLQVVVANPKPYKQAAVVGLASAYFERGEAGFFVLTVQDAQGRPVADARVTATYHRPDGSAALEHQLAKRSTPGEFQSSFQVDDAFIGNRPGRFVVVFRAEAGEPPDTAVATTAFFVNGLHLDAYLSQGGRPVGQVTTGSEITVKGVVGQFRGFLDLRPHPPLQARVRVYLVARGGEVTDPPAASPPVAADGSFTARLTASQPGDHEVVIVANADDPRSGPWAGEARLPLRVIGESGPPTRFVFTGSTLAGALGVASEDHSFEVFSGARRIRVRATWEPQLQDAYDLRLLDPDGKEVGFSGNFVNAPEEIVYDGPGIKPGKYTVVVETFVAVATVYRVEVQVDY